ncbi:lipoprotein NlpI [Prochlorococcus marinus str. MIT 1313]|uniref:tetratricopeptide repeat protein n=1 Tax=Prochlorococcus TaxID=1218 RepID=UPI0007B3D787|nr:tetratricopeptide repeat protein [Prochlorococcus marinus]KZR70149.1 lipoprotein NlpI [Prochlorococcus marinus str. MIT 1313]
MPFFPKLNTASDLYALAKAKHNIGAYQEAIEAFNKSLALHENWQSFKGLGWALCNTNQYQTAIEAFKKSLALHESWQSFKGLGLALGNTQQYQPAIEAFKRSLTLHEDWQSYQGLGWSLHLKRQYQPAIEAFNKSLTLHEDWQSYKGLGWALYETYQYQPAIEAFNKSLTLHEDWQSFKGLGWALYKTQQYQLAIETFNKSLALDEDWDIYKGLGWALYNTQQYQLAIEAFNKSLTLDEDWDIYKGLGWALYNTQQYQLAIEAFNKSLTLHEEWDAYQGLGLALYNTQQYEPAINAILNWWTSSGKVREKELLLNSIWNKYHGRYHALSKSLWTAIDLNLEDIDKPIKAEEDTIINEIQKSIRQNSLPSEVLRVLSFLRQKQVHRKAMKPKSHKIKIAESREENASGILSLDRHCKEILVFGVSHARIFDGIPGLTVVLVGAGTMFSIDNPNSRTGHNGKINSTLRNRDPSETIVVFDFGEIDLRMHINRIIKNQNKSMQEVCNGVLKLYLNFIDQIRGRGFDVIISGPHCGGGDAFIEYSITASITERNNACAYINDKLASECMARSVPFLTLFDLAVDQSTLLENTSLFRDFHHLHTPPNIIGIYIQSLLKARLEGAIARSKHFKANYYRTEITTLCRILIGNIPGWESGTEFMPREVSQQSTEIQDNRTYHAIIELPFPVHPREVVLSFNKNCLYIRTNVQAIFENYNPAIELGFNIVPALRGAKCLAADKNRHHFSEKDSTGKQSRYILISISQAKSSKLESISMCRYI